LGLAERDPDTDIFHNSVVLLGLDGEIKARRRKITAESKWACPGPTRQLDVADTPWGKIGLLICSETYFSLLPRALALKGADLLLVPANWPPGSLDPGRLWQSRALENGVYLAACNRAGQDKRLDMKDARSYLFDPWGEDLLAGREVEPGIFLAEIPLEDGRLPSADERGHRLADRKPGFYHYIYSNLSRIKDLKTYLELPEPGLLDVHALGLEVGASCQGEELWSRLDGLPGGGNSLVVLPALRSDRVPLSELSATADRLETHMVSLIANRDGSRAISLFSPGQPPRSWELELANAGEPPMVDLGPARVGLASATDLLHPELALAMAKRGCDLVAASGGMLAPDQQTVLGLRNLERVTLALAYRGGGLICSPPEGHQNGPRLEVRGNGVAHLALDTNFTRSKAYEDRLDYQLLLGPNGGEES
jgi:hypothetical protein